MVQNMVQQIRSVNHIAGPGGWRWVQLEDVANAIGTSAPELLRRFVDAGPTLGIWTAGGAYLVLVPSTDGISAELPNGDWVDFGFFETNEFLEIVGPVRVPLGWALEVAKLVERGYDMTNTVEFVNYNSSDELPQQDLLWISVLDLASGRFRAGYAVRQSL